MQEVNEMNLSMQNKFQHQILQMQILLEQIDTDVKKINRTISINPEMMDTRFQHKNEYS